MVAILAAVLYPGVGTAQEEDSDWGRVFAIQDRGYRMNHEFTLATSFLPLDAFYKYFALSGSYTVHFSDFWAWEAVHLTYANYLDINTGLEKEMLDKWGATPTETFRLLAAVDTNLVVKPMYGKMTLLDGAVVHLETYLLAGLGTIWTEKPLALPLAANVGAGMRLFLSNTISLRFEIRHCVAYYLDSGGSESILSLGFGFSYNAFAEDRPVAPGQPQEVAR